MSVELAKAQLRSFGLEDRVQEFTVSSATVELAAQALHCEPCHIAKTMAFLVGETPIVIVTAGDARIDNAKYKARFHTKAKMIPPEDLPRLVGHPMGGVCPFGVPDTVEVYLDCSLKRFEVVYPACGTPSSAVRLTPGELERCSRSLGWLDVCKLPQ